MNPCATIIAQAAMGMFIVAMVCLIGGYILGRVDK